MDIRANAPDWPSQHSDFGCMSLDPVVIAQSLMSFTKGEEIAPVATLNGVERLLVQAQAAAILARAIASLGEREILVLHLSFVVRLAPSETAQILDLGERRVRFIKKQALKQLHGQMGRHNADTQ